MTTETKTKQICTLTITIDGTKYAYEAHSFTRCAEILAGQLKVLDTGEVDQYGQTIYSHRIEDFTVHYFADAE